MLKEVVAIAMLDLAGAVTKLWLVAAGAVITGIVVAAITVASLLVSLFVHVLKPSSHVCSNMGSLPSPHFSNQAPPKAQQLRLPLFLLTPHFGHTNTGSTEREAAVVTDAGLVRPIVGSSSGVLAAGLGVAGVDGAAAVSASVGIMSALAVY